MYDGQIIDLEHRALGLVGDRKHCGHFCLQFCSALSIRYFFTTRMDYGEYEEGQQEGIKRIPLNRSVAEREGLLLILCRPHASRKEYDRLLHCQGFEWGEDYIDSLWVVQYFREKYRTALTEKKIWIFGAGNAGKRFREKYKDSYSIQGFLSNFHEERECMGLPVMRPGDMERGEDTYIVICSGAGEEISGQLRKMGLTAAEYGFPDTMPRKLFIGVGTCQVTNTVRILRKNVSFACLYEACSYIDSIYDACSETDNRRLRSYGRFCDVVFYNVACAETMDVRNYGPLINRYYTKAHRIFQPFYCFRGQLPQATAGENRYELESGWIWVRGDREVNEMIEKGCSEREILDRVSGENYWPEAEILAHFKRELRKTAVWDRFASFPIEPFIRQNCHKIQVFIDGTHFGFQLHLYLADKIAESLGTEPVGDPEVVSAIEGEQHSVMPMYPCVRRALGMENPEGSKFWNMETGSTEILGFEEHMKRYIQYVINVRNIYGESGTHFLF